MNMTNVEAYVINSKLSQCLYGVWVLNLTLVLWNMKGLSNEFEFSESTIW